MLFIFFYQSSFSLLIPSWFDYFNWKTLVFSFLFVYSIQQCLYLGTRCDFFKCTNASFSVYVWFAGFFILCWHTELAVALCKIQHSIGALPEMPSQPGSKGSFIECSCKTVSFFIQLLSIIHYYILIIISNIIIILTCCIICIFVTKFPIILVNNFKFLFTQLKYIWLKYYVVSCLKFYLEKCTSCSITHVLNFSN